MRFFSPIPNVHYRGCKLYTGKIWYVAYYVQDPRTKKLKRIRIKINSINPIRKRRCVARDMMAAIDERLALGWNPLLEAAAPKVFERIFDVIDGFMNVKNKEMEENSLRVYRSFTKRLKEWMRTKGGFTMESGCNEFTREVATDFMEEIEMSPRISARTYNNHLRFCQALFNWMQEKGYCEFSPFEGIPLKPKRLMHKKRRILSNEELSRLFAFLAKENSAYLAICMVCYCCFIRPKEIALLKCEDVDLEHQTIHIREDIAKNDRDSYRTIPDDMLPILGGLDLSNQKLYLFGQHDGYDFSPSKTQVCSRKIAKYWSDIVRPACGFGMDIQFYSLKDTGITNMLGASVPISFVQQQADHSSVAMTAIYVGKSPAANAALKKVRILPGEQSQD